MRRADAQAAAPSSSAAARPPPLGRRAAACRLARHASEKGQTGEVLLVQDEVHFKPGLARGLPRGYSLARALRVAELVVPLLPACLLTKDPPKGLQDPLIEPKVSVHKNRLVCARKNPVFFLLLFPARPPVEEVRERMLGVAGLHDTRNVTPYTRRHAASVSPLHSHETKNNSIQCRCPTSCLSLRGCAESQSDAEELVWKAG
jgi:hypothetical protein